MEGMWELKFLTNTIPFVSIVSLVSLPWNR